MSDDPAFWLVFVLPMAVVLEGVLVRLAAKVVMHVDVPLGRSFLIALAKLAPTGVIGVPVFLAVAVEAEEPLVGYVVLVLVSFVVDCVVYGRMIRDTASSKAIGIRRGALVSLVLGVARVFLGSLMLGISAVYLD